LTRADQLTYSRLVLGPLAFGLIAWGAGNRLLLWAALIVTVLGDLTDLFDGILARRHGGGTDVGKVADPFTDSVFRLSVYLGLTMIGQFPAWGFLLLVMRDSSNAFLRQVSALRGTALAARWSGKIKAWVQGVGAYVLIADAAYGFLPRWFWMAGTAFVALYTALSGVDYLWANRHVLRSGDSGS
jgi:CDP-diacylglycerol--glycerol-3-phosphate 3-phosphatidyltransferase